MRPSKLLLPIAVALSTTGIVTAGPIAYGVCQTACNAGAVTCYTGVGFTFGVTLVAAPPAILACNSILGACMALCTPFLIAPTP
ncbi:hypothetical protein F5887DRAFT_932693 [Amanita rubescens]|nr:hypothetical protein F5887DRAFT_614114 [Amanita rubescens]KAF8351851.1 hypothetical protein F5887DRAFT_932693 [Amanita rubescens]